MTLKSAGRLVLCLLLCLGIGLLESFVTRPEIPVWYAALAKPWWTPPPMVFPIAWTLLYILMAVSLWRLWDRATPSAARASAITWFFIQLGLNAAWSPVFFGWHGIRTALVIIIGLLIAIVMTMIAASRADKSAAWLLAPYLLWVAYATTLNAGVVAMN
ncbi:MAG TPA: TspO/MBR family protein [Afipia sp.]